MAPRGFVASLLLLAVALCCAAPPALAKDAFTTNVIELTSENFEHLTQVATGATTGDWLIEFYAPWCGHCKRLGPIYEQVANELKGEINVAKVDTTDHYDLSQRFEIKGLPTILFFRKGKMYKYAGPRTLEELTRFARSGYKTVTAEPVPPQMNLFGDITRHISIIYSDFLALLATKKNVLLATFSGGLLVGLLLGWMCSCCTARPAAPKPAASKPKTN